MRCCQDCAITVKLPACVESPPQLNASLIVPHYVEAPDEIACVTHFTLSRVSRFFSAPLVPPLAERQGHLLTVRSSIPPIQSGIVSSVAPDNQRVMYSASGRSQGVAHCLGNAVNVRGIFIAQRRPASLSASPLLAIACRPQAARLNPPLLIQTKIVVICIFCFVLTSVFFKFYFFIFRFLFGTSRQIMLPLLKFWSCQRFSRLQVGARYLGMFCLLPGILPL